MTLEELKQIAKLSRIKLTEQELEKFTPQMQSILDSAQILVNSPKSSTTNSRRKVMLKDLRDDIMASGFAQSEALANAPYTQDGYVKVYGGVTESIDS